MHACMCMYVGTYLLTYMYYPTYAILRHAISNTVLEQ